MAIISANKEFLNYLIQFVDLLENKSTLDETLKANLLSFGINRNEFDAMIERIRVYASYDEDKNHIDFPYENWIERLLTVTTTEEANEVKLANKKYRGIKIHG